MAEAIIQTDRLSKWFGQVIALNDVTINFESGITALLGPNGAGKSTLLRLIAGQLKPNLGDILVWGESIWNNPTLYRRIGFCADSEGFYWDMTGFGMIRFLAQLSLVPKDKLDQKIWSIMKTVGLTEQMNQKIGTYSKGMRQRLKLAQTLVHDPDLILLDEPFNGMDPVGRSDTIKLVRSLGESGHCVLVSSHILQEAESLTDNILLMQHGKLVAKGKISDIRDQMDGHSHKICVICRELRKLAEVCVSFEDVFAVRLEENANRLIVETHSPNQFYELITKFVLENRIQIEQMYSLDNNLEAVFDYLIKQK
ncbi:ABC transporter ATP-binding protein [Candidatus Poribacteria bacterium]|nr:ABC transporter ATP-binding protein [Candidatus Poribacteria bacterium]